MAQQNNMMAGLAYLLSCFISILGPLLIFFLAKEDRFVKFHALQALFLELFGCAVIFGTSIVLVIGMIVLGFANLGSVAAILSLATIPLVGLEGLALFLVYVWAMYKAFTGEKYMAPFVGGLADTYA